MVEAKKTSRDVEAGRKQAALYADALEAQYGQRPVIFVTNGYDIQIWDDKQGYPPRAIFGFYSKDSLQYLHVSANGQEAARANHHRSRHYQSPVPDRSHQARFGTIHRQDIGKH